MGAGLHAGSLPRRRCHRLRQVSWKWTRLRAVLISLGIIRSSEDGVKLLAGGHAAIIFGKCRGSGRASAPS
jgi:hypothetical protein